MLASLYLLFLLFTTNIDSAVGLLLAGQSITQSAVVVVVDWFNVKKAFDSHTLTHQIVSLSRSFKGTPWYLPKTMIFSISFA